MKKIGIVLLILGIAVSTAFAQEGKSESESKKEKKEKSTFLEIKDGSKPEVYIDGIRYDAKILMIVDKNKIEKVEVLKGEAALAQYDSPEVIVITTKVKKKGEKLNIRSSDLKVDLNDDSKVPVIVVDGEVKDKAFFDSISPDDIVSVSVLKDQKSLDKYNTNAGVIMIRTNKKKE